mgnify:CR=1 FL=1
MSEKTTAPLTLDTLLPGTPVTGTVTRLILSGALVNIGLEKDALLHVSQLGKGTFRNVEDVLNQGQSLEGYVLKVEGDRVALTMVKPPSLPWANVNVGEVYRGTVTRIEKFGAFVDIGAERPGMVHVSEMADGYVQSPEEVVRVGDVIEVRVIKFNRKKRQIDLSMREETPEASVNIVEEEDLPTAMALALQRARTQSRRDESRAANERRQQRYDDAQEEIYRRTLRSMNNK